MHIKNAYQGSIFALLQVMSSPSTSENTEDKFPKKEGNRAID